MLEPEFDRVKCGVAAEDRVAGGKLRRDIQGIEAEMLREPGRAASGAFFQPAADDRALVEDVAPRKDGPFLSGSRQEVRGGIAVGDDELRHWPEDGVTGAGCHGAIPLPRTARLG